MSTNKQEAQTSSTNKDNDESLDQMARRLLLEEAQRNKARAEVVGALGWQKPKLVTNRTFLHNTLISNAVHNVHKNEQDKQQRMNAKSYRREHDYNHHRKRSRTPPRASSSSSSSSRKMPHQHSDELSSKRLKKDK